MCWLLTSATVVLIVAACGDGDPDASSTPTVSPSAVLTASPSPTAAPTASPRPIPGAIELTRGPDAPCPDDMAFIIDTGCWGCDGGIQSLVRVYRDASGVIRSETILDSTDYDAISPTSGLPINGFAIERDASTIAVSLCLEGSCGPGGIIHWEADSVATILRSTDGGVTWEEIGRGGPALQVIGLVAGGGVLTVNYLERLGGIEFRILPGNELVEPPAGAANHSYAHPATLDGQIFWRTEDGEGVLYSDGSVLVSPDDEFRPLGTAIGELTPGAGRLLIDGLPSDSSSQMYALAVYDVSDRIAVRQQLYSSPGYARPGWWSPGDGLALIAIELPHETRPSSAPIPALLDMASGEYRIIADPFSSSDPPYGWPNGRSLVDAVQIGPFARVVDTGSCLNLRAEPSLGAQALDCMADGVLLRDLGEVSEADGVTWVRVSTPAGVEGWASAKYLER